MTTSNSPLFFLSNGNKANITAALTRYGITDHIATVGFPYEDMINLQGSIITLGRFDPKAHMPPPCSEHNKDNSLGIKAIVVPTITADILGGGMALLGVKPASPKFWRLVQFVEVFGTHQLSSVVASEEDINRLFAFWFLLFQPENKCDAPADGTVVEITSFMKEVMESLSNCISGNEPFLGIGLKYRRWCNEFNQRTFWEKKQNVILRFLTGDNRSPLSPFLAPDGVLARAVVSFSNLTQRITVSFADEPKELNAIGIIRTATGHEAEGTSRTAQSQKGFLCGVAMLARTYEIVCRHMDGSAKV